jgi:hypothetical protein
MRWPRGKLYTSTERCSLRISVWTGAILIEVFHGFPQFLQASAGIILPLIAGGSFDILSNSSVILPSDAIYYRY